MIYILIAVLLFLLSMFYDFSRKTVGKEFSMFAVWLILIALAAFRYRVGGDTLNYIYIHDILPNLSELTSFDYTLVNREPGWLLFSAICKSINPDFVVVQIFHAIIVNSVFLWFINKHTNYQFTCLFIYFSYYYLYINFEILREALALCIFMLTGVHSLIRRNWWKYSLTVVACFMFHSSSLILIIIPFLYKFASNERYRYFWITSGIFISGLLFGSLFNYILPYFYFNAIIKAKLEVYELYSFTYNGIISSYILYVLLPLGIYYQLKGKVNPKLLAFLVVYALIGSLTTYFSIFFRFLNYLIPVYIISISHLYIYILNRGRNHALNVGNTTLTFIFISFFFVAKWFGPINGNSNLRWYVHWVPYYSVFEKQTDSDRETNWINQH